MASTTGSRNPFELPELVHRLSRFGTVKDSLTCALVSKAWTNDFVSSIWFKVDFEVHLRFVDLSPDTVSKYGRHIRIVRNAKSLSQVSTLANFHVNKLRNLQIDTSDSIMQHVYAYEIIHRNKDSLEILHIFATSLPIPPVKMIQSAVHYVTVPALIPPPGISSLPPPKLKVLKIERLCLTRDGLVAILRACPSLSILRLPHTDIIGAPTQTFQHMGLKTFGAPLRVIFPDTPTPSPSLLLYFPSLNNLHTFNYNPSSSVMPSTDIRKELARFCPQLIGYHLEDGTGAIVTEFLTNIANSTHLIMFRYEHISSEIIKAILLHKATLKTIMHFHSTENIDNEKEEITPVTDHFSVSGHVLQLIPRSCAQLEHLNLHHHEMDMDIVEQGEWVCKDLQELRIRVKNLDTKDKILKAIALWRVGCWRRRQKMAGVSVAAVDDEDQNDQSIETRVARHLLKFERLWWVWLGYQTWTPM